MILEHTCPFKYIHLFLYCKVYFTPDYSCLRFVYHPYRAYSYKQYIHQQMRLIKQNTVHNTLRTPQYYIILISQCCGYLARSQNCEKQLLRSSRVSVRLELGSHWTYFHEI